MLAALAIVAVLILVGGAFAAVRLLGRHHDSAAAPAAAHPAAATGTGFSGMYRADYGPGTDLEGTALPNVPGTTSAWNVRASCASGGCIANAAYSGKSAAVVAPNLTFDQIGSEWVAVATGSVQCNNAPIESWVVFTLTPRPDGTLTGETVRATTNGCSIGKRAVTFTRTGDGDPSAVPDPATLPPRTASLATTLRGRYHENIVYANGNFPPGSPDLQVRTQCLRTGDRCISVFHASDGDVTLVFANGKWTRNEEGTVPCSRTGTTQLKITADFPMPEPLLDPISSLDGHGQSTSANGECTGGDFTDKFVRTGD